ncbi:hypothetical protein [Sporosarcina sp. JAI121]|uniref:hypothetical protein n=1 Tax=Sporosarcina sp. JAI121 TaxID=2723064 RepID=UPI0015CA31D6|nr:hypothetical protein [Sporosarcina sp. JAI121]NYF24065.1 hypothetical protein [Sporosarcina sp. JAI121]
MWKKLALFLFLFIGLIISIPTVNALAAPDLTVTVSVGIDGKVKEGKGAPLVIVVENNGTAFNGDLVIDVPNDYMTGSGEAIPLDIGAGETKTISLVIPNVTNMNEGMSNAKTIFLYEGGWEKGKEIVHKGAQKVTAALFYHESKFIVTFTENPDRLGALKNSRILDASNNQIISTSKMSEPNIPVEAAGWGAADFIIVDEYPLADLSAKKQEALLGWVRSGGILVIGGYANVNAEAGIFSGYLPLTLKGSIESNPEVLNNWVGIKGFEGVIHSYLSELNPSALPLLEDEENVLIAYSQVGRGQVVQTAFSVGDDPISTAVGMPALWSKLFDTAGQQNQFSQNQHDNPRTALAHSVGRTNELFPSFKVSAPLVFGIIIFYIILIIPVLYIILKRKDKREYAWWIIPSIAIVTSIAIFAYGAKDRIGGAQIQHSAIVNVEQDGSLSGYYVESILSNKSGDFTLTAPAETTLSASLPANDPFVSTPGTIHKHAIVEKDATGSKLHLRNIGYWNVGTVYGETRLEKKGNYEIQLNVTDKKLTGTVTNEFPFALTEVAIWSGTKLIPIGDLGPGESVQVDETLKTSTLLPRKSMFNPYMNPTPVNMDDLMKMRKDSLLSFSSDYMNNPSNPVIIGYTDTQIVPIELPKAKPSVSALTMVVQPIKSEVAFTGMLSIEPEMMEMVMISEDGQTEPEPMGSAGDDYYFGQAVYNQIWRLPAELVEKKMKWTSIEVSKIQKQLYGVSILNVRTKEYEQSESGKLMKTENLNDYITPEGEVIVRIVFHDAKNGNQGRAPVLKMIGEVAQ